MLFLRAVFSVPARGSHAWARRDRAGTLDSCPGPDVRGPWGMRSFLLLALATLAQLLGIEIVP